MYLSSKLEREPGVLRAAAIMGTPANKNLLTTLNLATPETDAAEPNDLVIVVRAVDDRAASSALARLEGFLAERPASPDSAELFFHSIEAASQALSGTNLAVISVPGPHAGREARKALNLGLHVFLFSDNVSLAEEIALKKLARDRGLLLMGPDCGTALVGGLAVGFANAVRKGPIGITGASGTGIQEVSVLLERAGLGVSHALGTGSRDLSGEVGAITTLQAVEMLEDDPETKALVIISKPPAPKVLKLLLARLKRLSKPVVACLLGYGKEEQNGNTYFARTLADAAETAAAILGRGKEVISRPEPENLQRAARERSFLHSGQRHLRGVFSGGSLCLEAMLLWQESIGRIWSNIPLKPDQALPDPRRSFEHSAIDLGDDLFTAGCPHPMINPTVRLERILQEADDPSVAVIVLDIVLGYGAHPDMAGALLPAIIEGKRKAESAGRHLAVVAHVLGTESDPQGLQAQEEKLRSAGVLLAPSNAAAAELASFIVRREGAQTVA
jgi:succinyl-CoA synthetase alpha subunit